MTATAGYRIDYVTIGTHDMGAGDPVDVVAAAATTTDIEVAMRLLADAIGNSNVIATLAAAVNNGTTTRERANADDVTVIHRDGTWIILGIVTALHATIAATDELTAANEPS